MSGRGGDGGRLIKWSEAEGELPGPWTRVRWGSCIQLVALYLSSVITISKRAIQCQLVTAVQIASLRDCPDATQDAVHNFDVRLDFHSSPLNRHFSLLHLSPSTFSGVLFDFSDSIVFLHLQLASSTCWAFYCRFNPDVHVVIFPLSAHLLDLRLQSSLDYHLEPKNNRDFQEILLNNGRRPS